jgi:hypothetical protein
LVKAKEKRKRKRGKNGEGREYSGYQFTSKLVHATIGEAAVSRLLKTNNADVSEQTIIDQPLLTYAAEYWYEHATAVTDAMADFPQLRNKLTRSLVRSIPKAASIGSGRTIVTVRIGVCTTGT